MRSQPPEADPLAPDLLAPDLLSDVLARCAADPDAPAISTARSGTLSYGQLGRQVAAVAAGLNAAGMRPGDRVLFSVRPEPFGVVLALAVVAAGGTVVFVDLGGSAEVFAARLRLAAPRWAAAESLLHGLGASALTRRLAAGRGLLLPRWNTLASARADGGAPVRLRHLYVGPWLPGVPRGALSVRSLARRSLARRFVPAVAGPSVVERAPDQEAVIVFTSGTTAAPRAVVHSRGSLGAAAVALTGRCPTGPGDVVHTDQLMVGLPTLTTGAHWTMPPFGLSARADPARFAAGLVGATSSFTVPADLAVLLEAIENGQVPAPARLRRVQVGGAPVLVPLLQRAARVLPGVEVEAVYGMTEILPVAIVAARRKLAWTGPGDLLGEPLPGVVARIADDGELMLSGPARAVTLLGEPPTAEQATGDLARWVEGQLVLVGRKKDMIIRRWTNVYPGLFEPALSRLPGVEAAVMVGIPDGDGDEQVVLAVVPSGVRQAEPPRILDDDTLLAQVTASAAGVVDAESRPDRVVLLSALPVSGRSRKPDRAALRDLVRGSRA